MSRTWAGFGVSSCDELTPGTVVVGFDAGRRDDSTALYFHHPDAPELDALEVSARDAEVRIEADLAKLLKPEALERYKRAYLAAVFGADFGVVPAPALSGSAVLSLHGLEQHRELVEPHFAIYHRRPDRPGSNASARSIRPVLAAESRTHRFAGAANHRKDQPMHTASPPCGQAYPYGGKGAPWA